MKNKKATLIGATGLIGSSLLELLQNDSEFSQITVLIRRPITFTNPKVKPIVIDFKNLESLKRGLTESDVIFSAIGTTNKKMKGNEDEYRKVDFDIAANAAKLGLEIGCEKFVLVSSVGADSKSNNFYLKLKGEIEDELSSLKLAALHIFRPSLLIGKRKEFRLGEILGRVVMVAFSFVVPSRMKAIKAKTVAKSMLEAAKLDSIGVNIYHYKEMKQLVK